MISMHKYDWLAKGLWKWLIYCLPAGYGWALSVAWVINLWYTLQELNLPSFTGHTGCHYTRIQTSSILKQVASVHTDPEIFWILGRYANHQATKMATDLYVYTSICYQYNGKRAPEHGSTAKRRHPELIKYSSRADNVGWDAASGWTYMRRRGKNTKPCSDWNCRWLGHH
jgi:hypothetical protein